MTLCYLIIILLSYSHNSKAHESDLDKELKSYIDRFRLRAIEKPTGKNVGIYKLGKKLFFDKELSGNKNISCSSCHDPSKGTGDGLPLPIGVTPTTIITRNSPPLFNLHHSEVTSLFWDGRISYDSIEDIYKTPSNVLNGDYPERWDITQALGSTLAAQAIFPLISSNEMKGAKGTNDIANATADVEAWRIIVKRLLSLTEYKKLFKHAFPNVKEINIGHVGHALAHFQTHEFAVYDTPWDNYLRGNYSSLSKQEKRGAIVFNTSGKCTVCHSGALLGGQVFANIASPQIGPGKDTRHNDQGRFEATGDKRHRYLFKTPPLRNVALTAPYFHSGSYKTLSDVIDHYLQGTKALDNYDRKWLKSFEEVIYSKKLYIETNPYRLLRKKENAHPLIKNRVISLTQQEKLDLELFLKKSLTDIKYNTKSL